MTYIEKLNTLTPDQLNERITMVDSHMYRNEDGTTYYRMCVGFGETYGSYAKSPLTFIIEHDDKWLNESYWLGHTFKEVFTYVNTEMKGFRVIKSPNAL